MAFNSGSLTTAANPAGTITYDYDQMGRIIDQSWTVPGLSGTKTVTTTYHASGQVLAKAWPDGDTTGTPANPWTYDEAGRLFAIPNSIVSTLYNAAGQITNIAYANGVATENTYNDARGWIMAIATRDSATPTPNILQSVGYTRDDAGRILSMTSGPAPMSEAWTYTYAGLDRLLTSVNGSDAASNRSFTVACPRLDRGTPLKSYNL